MNADSSNQLHGELRQREPMARHTSWRVGGCAEQFYRPADINDLADFIKGLDNNEPLFFVGLGSNLLVRDGGLRGTVICTSGVMNNIDFLSDEKVYVEAGLASPQLARQCARRGLRGVEFLCGIPGTVGGALAMNAGARCGQGGGEIWDIVESVQMVDRNGQLHNRTIDEFEVAYRSVKGKQDKQQEEWFVSAILKLTKGDADESQAQIKAHLAQRSATQPTQWPNAGSVFRNPTGDYAARLIENAGLKNMCVGGACVSEKHANFIINTGTATANDVETLIEKVLMRVKQEYNIDLIREVRIVGEPDELK
ncbi:MAG: UDP-N-acetylmuramate dehydrogenase [Gammaproteobacteria bacterium]|nr:UDP-N-acetylmuramate dehydrogenase [Gammaproteobacteria bacterium]